MNRQLSRYRDALENLPLSGGGCHTALLSAANLARIAGVDPERTIEDLAAHIHGTRRVPRSEIQAAVRKAFDSPALISKPRATRSQTDSRRLLNAILERGCYFTEQRLWEESPVKIDWPPEHDSIQTLGHLYHPSEKLFIGARHESAAEHVQRVDQWIFAFGCGAAAPEHIVPNPLIGEKRLTKDGKQSFRADSCVAAFRFATVEFDEMPLSQQIQFWAGVQLPIAALIHSAGKSIHAWIRIDAADATEWEQNVEETLFDLLRPLGVDGACRNEARLSRMPGHFRIEKNQRQRLLYLAPQGRPVQP